MCFKNWRIFCLIPFFCFANAQDDLYPELLSKLFYQETEDIGQSSWRLMMGDELTYRVKIHISRGDFNLYQLSEGDKSDIKHCCSFSYDGDYFSIMYGRGSPQVACGMLLGNTMMGFTAEPITNVGLYRSKCRIQNNFYHKDLIAIKGYYRDLSLKLFRLDDRYVCGIDISNQNIYAGTYCYFLDNCVVESFLQYDTESYRIGTDISFGFWGLNHVMGDLLYRDNKLKLYLSSVYLGGNFEALKSDSKWGSALKAGSYGFSTGLSYLFNPLKLRLSATRIHGKKLTEDKILLDLTAKYKNIKVSGACNYKYRAEIKQADSFPFLLQWQNKRQLILKCGVTAKIGKKLKLTSQIQTNVLDPFSYVLFCRLSYVKNSSRFLLQLSQSEGFNSDLYYLRPLACTSYSIRKAGYEEAMFLDLAYEYKFNKVSIGIVIRSEGVLLNMQIK